MTWVQKKLEETTTKIIDNVKEDKADNSGLNKGLPIHNL